MTTPKLALNARAFCCSEKNKMTTTLSVREYARQRGITMHAVYLKLWDGKLPAVKRDGRWEIPLRPDQTRGLVSTSPSSAANADVTGA
jgi:hypothetical protein